MNTKIQTPLTDSAEKQWHEHHAEYAIRDLCRELEQLSLNKHEAELVICLVKLWHACWEDGRCARDCKCSKCLAFEEAGDHDKATFDSLTEKASAQQALDHTNRSQNPAECSSCGSMLVEGEKGACMGCIDARGWVMCDLCGWPHTPGACQ